MKTLCVDLGNTYLKLAAFDQHTMLAFDVFNPDDFEKILKFIQLNPAEAAIFSTVSDSPETILEWLRMYISNILLLDHQTPIPVENLYATPETLGKDRLAAVVGGSFLYPKCNLLIIDAGTAITFDLLNSKGQYLGGNISPGLQTRFKALNHFTKRLPLVTVSEVLPDWGTNTVEAIRAGVQLGIQFEIDGAIAFYQSQFQGLKIILTGGDTDFLLSKLKNPIFAVPNLVMIGLNRILGYNLNQG
jgi:type III pantothenate kinase